MKIIFAQGNPGPQYERTRHNTGFLVIEAVASKLGLEWKRSNKFSADIAESSLDDEKVLFVKPGSYYNETGLIARQLVDFYKLAPSTDILVIHDDLALPLGTIRVRQKGSDAGNNGVKSLNAHIGESYWRLRIGIWNELRDRMDDADFVLAMLSKDETAKMRAITPEVISLIKNFSSGNLTHLSSQF